MLAQNHRTSRRETEEQKEHEIARELLATMLFGIFWMKGEAVALEVWARQVEFAQVPCTLVRMEEVCLHLEMLVELRWFQLGMCMVVLATVFVQRACLTLRGASQL